MSLYDLIMGRSPPGADPADIASFMDNIRRHQHYAFSRHRRRIHRYVIAMEIENGLIDIGGES